MGRYVSIYLCGVLMGVFRCLLLAGITNSMDVLIVFSRNSTKIYRGVCFVNDVSDAVVMEYL